MAALKNILRALAGGAALVLTMKLLTSAASKKKQEKAAGLNDRSIANVEDYLEAQIKRLNIPGAVMAIVEDDQIVHYSSYGSARPGGEAPSPQTPYLVGSLTKSITALAVMQLVEAKKIDLEAPVQHYLPWFRVADPRVSSQITVRHLLNQNSGLPGMPGYGFLANFDDQPDATERQVRSLAKIKIAHPVGSTFEYSNLNYNILGLIIEAVSGESYPSYIQEHIFNPLGMHRTYCSKELAMKNGLAVGSRHWFGRPFPARQLPEARGSLPSGQLASCAEDLARYLLAHINGGYYGGVRVLSQAGMDELHRGAAEIKNAFISNESYGMGWFELHAGRSKVIYHGGNMPDFTAFAAFLPSNRKGLIVLFNNGMYGLPMMIGEVGLGLTAVLAGEQPAPSKFNAIQWIMRSLPLIPILQVYGIVSTLRRISLWKHKPHTRPGKGSLWSRHILLPLVPDLALTGMLGYVLKNRIFGFLKLFMPDFASITLICGSFAAFWSIVRTRLLMKTVNNDRTGF